MKRRLFMKIRNKLSIALIVILILYTSVWAKQKSVDLSFYTPPASNKLYPVMKDTDVKNVILCIGDGMGIGQVAISRIKGASLNDKLYMEKMPFTGILRTHSANALTTDSAAAAAAIASGIKTNNGMLGMTADGTKYLTILEAAEKRDRKTGLVVSSQIWHATPAAFAAHVESRGMIDTIVEQLIDNKIEVLFGGGKDHFLPKDVPGGKRSDNKDMLAAAKEKGYLLIENKEQLANAQNRYLLGLFNIDALTTVSPEPSLAELTEKAIESLNTRHDKKDNGFFLMVEGSQIDWMSHKNDIENSVRQTLLFDQVIKTAIDFAIKDKRTLVVVVADHETGGLTFTGDNLNIDDAKIAWATDGHHSATPIIVYALGPKADMFTGVYDNTEIAKKLASIMEIRNFPKKLK